MLVQPPNIVFGYTPVFASRPVTIEHRRIYIGCGRTESHVFKLNFEKTTEFTKNIFVFNKSVRTKKFFC